MAYFRAGGCRLTNQAEGGHEPPHHEGENHPTSVLTEAQVLEIRRRYATEDSHAAQLAREYGVWPNAVWMILHRITWDHLPPVDGELGSAVTKPRPWLTGQANPAARLTEVQVREIRRRYLAEELTITDLAGQYGMRLYAIYALLNRQTWAHLPPQPGEATRTRTAKEAAELRDRKFRQPGVTRKKRSDAGIPTHRPPGNTKLSPDQVRAIRRRHAAGATGAALAAIYGVSGSLISAIIAGRRWGHLKDADPPRCAHPQLTLPFPDETGG
jgi:hypothetical protein